MNPSTEEQFDQLLKELVGHSLKENETLWTAFQHLRTARNKFVHEGTAKIGKETLDEPGARLLLTHVDAELNEEARILGWSHLPGAHGRAAHDCFQELERVTSDARLEGRRKVW